MLNQDAVKLQELQEMGHRNTICEAVLNVKDALEIAYPHSTFFIVASDMHLNEKGVPQRYRIATKKGDHNDITIETTEISVLNRWLADTCIESALNIIVSHQPQNITARASAELHDAALDYARYLHLNIDGYEYCRDSPKWRDRLKAATVTDASPSGQADDPICQWQVHRHIRYARPSA